MKKILFPIVILAAVTLIIAFNTSGGYLIVNKTGSDVTKITIAPSGDNFNNSESFSTRISKGESSNIDYSTSNESCSYDVKFTDNLGQEYIMYNIELCNNKIIELANNKADVIEPVRIQTAH